MRINLFYMTPNNTGGHVTYTHHLSLTLQMMGADVYLYKIRDREEQTRRPFGYGLLYRNITLDVAKQLPGAKLIVATNKPMNDKINGLLAFGARVVIHDPAEFKHGWDHTLAVRPIVIRKSMLAHIPDAVFIRHPYIPFSLGKRMPTTQERKLAISTSRIDFDKNTHILLDANRSLADEHKIVIRGFENRIYTRFKIVPEYPEWEQSKAAYPREADAAFNLLREYLFMVDMSLIKGDGGGTQYSWLEAWDAGAVPIVNAGWIQPKGAMKPNVNCLTVEDGAGLAALLSHAVNAMKGGIAFEGTMSKMRKEGSKELRKHGPEVIGPKYLEELI
jgi:glycosyltransferase involved in cell wall biosynthesis